ncbi:MAG: T9SS type A sorting domain-containing protein [Bacteroidota bacterium]
MLHKRLKLSSILLLVLGLTGVQAQTSVNATGSNATGSGGSASFSVGQVTYQTHTGTNGSVAEGVQQPYEISVVIGIEEAKGVSMKCFAFPNPATDILTLKIEGDIKSQCTITLYDLNGNLLENKKSEGLETIISMKNLVPATYFLKVEQGEKEIQSFKIVKN